MSTKAPPQQGAQGPQGPQGFQGRVGAGAPGPQGTQGPQGEPGGGSGAAFFIKDEQFIAKAGQTIFTLSYQTSNAAILVNLNGLVLNPNAHYTVNNTVLTLTTGAQAGAALGVRYLGD